jgi:hypothetical protein
MKSYTAAGVSVNGNGTHTVTCTAANNTVDPQASRTPAARR